MRIKRSRRGRRRRMKIISWNVNGIRAAAKNGFFDWLKGCQADVVLLQEVRAEVNQLAPEWIAPFDYKSYFFPAQKKGYSGVGVYVKKHIQDTDVLYGLGEPSFDEEGRAICLRVGKLMIFGCYFPNSQRLGARLDYKLAFCNHLQKTLHKKIQDGFGVVLSGDFNIAHTEIDLANPKQNIGNAGFLPEERAWMSNFLTSGFADSFRLFEKGGGHYTWWKNFPASVRERNVGWRLDYHCISQNLVSEVCEASIQPQVRGSDHCPVTLELKNI